MDLISLLITVIGVMILLGLYVMSRLFKQTPAKQNDKEIKIPSYTDASGNPLSSIKADIPARDQPSSTTQTQSQDQKASSQATTTTLSPAQQLVLFIASKTTTPLQGDTILLAMQELKLSFGDKQLYHYLTPKDDMLFSVANGIAPWTLSEEDLKHQTTPGLSIIMPLPTPIDSKEAINTMVDISLALAEKINGELQNSQQQIFLETDRELMLEKAK